MATILHEQQTFEVERRQRAGDGLWLSAADVERITGFVSKPEGLCRDALCVPVPRGPASFVDGDAIDLAAFWRHIGHPLANEARGDVWVLGVGAQERQRALDSLEAPDFALPDLEGRMHRLSDYRGRKVYLASWASW